MEYKSDKEYLNQLYQARENNTEHQYDQGKQFDQNMFLVSSGVFGISFTFMHDVVNKPMPDTKWLIIASWSALMLNIVVSLSAYLIVYMAYKRNIEIIDFRIGNPNGIGGGMEPKNPFTRIAEVVNVVNIVLFVVGLFFLIMYIGINTIGGTYVAL